MATSNHFVFIAKGIFLWLFLLQGLEAKSIFVLEDLLGKGEVRAEKEIREGHKSANPGFEESLIGSKGSFKEDFILEPQKNSSKDEQEDIKYEVFHGCRSILMKDVSTPEECAFYSSGSRPSIAVCRWDPNIRESGGCLCPRNKGQCVAEHSIRSCYWYSPGHESSEGTCISNAEKFYQVLHGLLLKRGKKDFAIRILYNSSPAIGALPYGPHGPSIIYPRGVQRPLYPSVQHYGGASRFGSNSPLHNYIGLRRQSPNPYYNKNPNYNSPLGYSSQVKSS